PQPRSARTRACRHQVVAKCVKRLRSAARFRSTPAWAARWTLQRVTAPPPAPAGTEAQLPAAGKRPAVGTTNRTASASAPHAARIQLPLVHFASIARSTWSIPLVSPSPPPTVSRWQSGTKRRKTRHDGLGRALTSAAHDTVSLDVRAVANALQ